MPKNSSHFERLKCLIQSVDWSTGEAEPGAVADLLQKKIVEKYKISDTQSVAIYQRLFYYVFRVISKSGIKRLTISEITPLDVPIKLKSS